jgi:hypothetical protein
MNSGMYNARENFKEHVKGTDAASCGRSIRFLRFDQFKVIRRPNNPLEQQFHNKERPEQFCEKGVSRTKTDPSDCRKVTHAPIAATAESDRSAWEKGQRQRVKEKISSATDDKKIDASGLNFEPVRTTLHYRINSTCSFALDRAARPRGLIVFFANDNRPSKMVVSILDFCLLDRNAFHFSD